MAVKTQKAESPEADTVLSEEEKAALAVMEGGTSDEVQTGDDQESEANHDDVDQSEESDGVRVVVCKGRTLYHNGKKYPPTHRLEMAPEDAEPLIKSGVVIKFDDLLQKVSGHGD
ncbi:hypothetical protein AXA14_004892 [Escherichia coli]|nr:hypothetical protein [Escherichia coli]